MRTQNRISLAAVFLLGCLMVMTLTARADSVTTYNLTINWWDPDTGVFPPSTTGSFTLKITTSPASAQLTDWSIDTPVAGVFNKANSSPAIIVPITCGGQPCFEFQFQQAANPLLPTLTITFAGSVLDYNGGPIVSGFVSPGALSRVRCNDPCNYYITRGQTVPEPSSLVLFGIGAVGAAFNLRRRLVRRLRNC